MYAMGLPTLQWRSVERQRNPTTAELPDQGQKHRKTGQYETDRRVLASGEAINRKASGLKF